MLKKVKVRKRWKVNPTSKIFKSKKEKFLKQIIRKEMMEEK